MNKKISILGSTGSIGTNALRVIDSLGAGYDVVALTAHSNVDMLAEQVRKYRPKVVGITDANNYSRLKEQLADVEVEIVGGADGLTVAASIDEADVVITAVVGAAGLRATMAAVEKGKIAAIANKEPLVMAGQLLMKAAKENAATILPVDSEHSAVFQALSAGRSEEVNKIILTASGGPLRGADKAKIENADTEQVLAHPTWDMGKKITVDSATMMNKALEVIEARWLFDVEADRIDVLVHPESIVHSLVEFVDGSVIAQMSVPDMCLPIQYALTYPRRIKGITPHLKLDELGKLTFEKPDVEIFRALKLGFEVASQVGTAGSVFNGANEAAVESFLAGRIKFHKIVDAIEHCLDKHKQTAGQSVEELIEADLWARREVEQWIKTKT